MKRAVYGIMIGFIIIGSITAMNIYANTTDEKKSLELGKLLRSGKFTPDQVKGVEGVMKLDRIEYSSTIVNMADKSNLVVKGKIISTESKATSVNGSLPQIHTIYVLELSEIIKGTTEGSFINIFQYGGYWNGLKCVVSDDPLMQVGDEVVLFLVQMEPNLYRSYGGPQGRYLIQEGKVFNIGELDCKASVGVPNSLFANGQDYLQFKSLVS